MKIKPLPGYVLIETEKQTQTKSGIILAKETEENQGLVIAVSGNLMTDQGEIKCPVKVGDKVYFSQFVDELDKKKLVRFIDLMAVIE